jgi:hypothetical protein
LDGLLLDEPRQELALALQCAAEVVPFARERVRLDARELEVVDPAEEPQRNVPPQLADQVVEQRLGRTAPGQTRVDG